MSFAGDLWSSVNRYASQAKFNLKTNLVGTGDQILAKSPGSLIVGQLASVTADSSGGSLLAGDIVQWNGSSWQKPGTTTTPFINTLIEAVQNTWFVNRPSVTKEMFYTSGTGGTYANTLSGTNVYILATTGATSANSANLRCGGFTLSFSQPSAFTVRIQLADSTTSTVARCGINMETADAVTTNTAKYGFEGCTTCNETFISVISSEGSLRSKNTQSTDTYSSLGNYGMRLDPGINTKYRKESGTIITKGTEVPSTGVTDRANTWLCGVQTTTTQSRTLQLYALNATGEIGDTMPVI